MFSFDLPESIRKPLVFSCFQGDQKATLGIKGLTPPVMGSHHDFLLNKKFRVKILLFS